MTDYLIGVDVSSNNSSNWEDDAWDYCWVKCTEGKSYVNPEYARQLSVVRERGKVAGHYHWLNDGDVAAQVNWFVSKAVVRAGEIIAVDWEDKSNPSTAQKDDAIRKLQAAYPDNKVGLYCNRDWWINHDTSSFFGDYLWIANYTSGSDPGIQADWTFWQYTCEPYDKNRGKFADLAALQAWAGSTESPPEPIDPVAGGVWYSTDYLFPQIKPDPTNPNGVKKGDKVAVTASSLTARVLPGGPPREEEGEILSRPQGYTFEVKADLLDGWVSGGTNWYSSDYLKVATEPPPPAKPGWKSTPYKVLPMTQVPGSVSYLQGVMHVNGCTTDEGDVYDPCWIIAQDYNNAGDIRFLKFTESGTYQSWFQVNDAGHGQTFYAYRSAGGNLYVWCGENAAYRHAWASGKKVSKTSGTKMDYKGCRPMGGFNDRVAFRDATDTTETFYLFDRTDFTDGTNKTTPMKSRKVNKRTDRAQQSYGATNDRIYRIYGSTNETPGSSSGKHTLDVFDWNGNLLLDRMDLKNMYRSGCDENEPEGIAFVSTPGAILCGMREGPASASKRSYVLWEMTNLP